MEKFIDHWFAGAKVITTALFTLFMWFLVSWVSVGILIYLPLTILLRALNLVLPQSAIIGLFIMALLVFGFWYTGTRKNKIIRWLEKE